MKAIIQRVSSATVRIGGEQVAGIGYGFLVYLGFAPTDNKAVVDYVIDRIAGIRIISDENGKMNLNLDQGHGDALFVPNFTLYADTSSRRPSFCSAMEPKAAAAFFEYACKEFSERYYGKRVEQGVFGADMEVESVVDGPINVIIEKLAGQ